MGFRHSPAAVLVCSLILTGPTLAATITWTGAISTNWDHTTANFNGAVFADGNHVRFEDTGVVQSNITIVGTVSPGSITISNTAAKPFTFTNGVIAGNGTLLKHGAGSATFHNYLSGLDFAGGTLVRSGHVRWVFSLAGVGAKTNHFGTGPITLDGGNFQLHNTGTPTFRLTNAVAVTANGGSLSVAGNQAASGQTQPNIRFTGPIHLGGRLTIGQIVGGGGNGPGPFYDGTITIDQTTTGPRILVIANGGNAAPTVAGNIVDGSGTASNVLVVGPWDSGNGRDVTIAGTANTYAAGTIITNFGGVRQTIVQTNSSLGRGDVWIVSNATLRLTGPANIGTNAHVNVQGTVIFTNAVTNVIDRLTFGTNSYTKGLWHPGNAAPYLQGNGAFDLGINDLPLVTILTPTNGQVLVEGDTVPYIAAISDSDPIQQADFRVGGASVGILGAEPWATNWTYVTIGAHALTVIATDFNTATGTSGVVNVTVVAPTPAALTWNGLQNRLWDNLSTNWTGGRTLFHKDDIVTFDDTAPGPVHLPWNVYPASATFDATGHFTLSGARIASGTLTKSGSGTLTLSNDVAGPIILNAGTLAETKSNSCALILAGGTLRGTIFTGPIQLTGAVAIDAQTLTGPIHANGAITGVHPLVIAGNITTGSITLANVILTGTNTHHFTTVGSNVVVAAHSSLGSGDVLVNGSLVLNGSSNLAATAALTINGTVSNAPGVKIRLTAITTNGLTLTAGLFRYGAGDFRLPPTNLMPVCVITNPVEGAQFYTGDALPLRIAATDTDSYIALVEFFVNDAKIGERTTPPYTAFLPGATNGSYALRAVATDDDGGVTTSAVVNVTVTSITPATLTWTAAVSRDWDTETANWSGSRTVFHNGDSVIFTNTGAGTNFIGSAGIALPVAPAAITISTPSNYVFSGGGIISNATLLKQGTGTATFNGYTNTMKDALGFDGGMTLKAGIVRWNVDTRGVGVQTGAFGRAGIVLDGGSLHLGNSGTPTFHFTNTLTVTGNGGSLGAATSQQASGQTLPNLRFSGPIALAGHLRIGQVVGGGGNAPGPHYDGTITIDQSATGLRQITLTGGGNSGPTLNARIVDGAGSASNALVIGSADSGNGRAATITGTQNTYGGGTIFTNISGSFSVMLATNATLGTGNLTIVSGASVTFQSGGVLKSNAALNVQGRLSLFTNVIVKVRELTLGPNTYTSGNYSNANGGGYLLGGGIVRVGGSNDAPSIAITNPVNGDVFSDGANIPIRTNARDDDGSITNVIIWAGTNVIANLTEPPWSITWSNVPGGQYSLTARACDNEGATTLSAPVLIEVLNDNFEIYTASYLSGSTNHDRGEAVDIAPDGTVVWAGTLTATNYGRAPIHLLGGGDGAVLRLNTNGTEVVSITRIGARVDDMEVDRDTGNIAVIGATVSGSTTNCFVGVLNSNATDFIWQTWLTPSGGGASDSDDPGRRVAIAADGTVAALHGKRLTVLAADGTPIGSRSHGNSFVNDVAIDATTKSVFVAGFDNKNLPGDNACPGCPVQVAYLYSYAYTNWSGTAQWVNWGWAGTLLNGNEADTRAYRLHVGRDGYLYLCGESAGGNSIYRWDPKNLNASGNLVTYDMYNTAYNTGANHITYYCRMDPSNGNVLKGQFALARLPNTAGNTIRPRAIAADEGGYVYVGGTSAYQIQNRSAKRINGMLTPPYAGGDSYLLIVQPDFLLRKVWTVFTGPGNAESTIAHNSYVRALAAGNGTAALASTLNGLAVTTANAIQAEPYGVPASTNTEGYVAVWQSQQGKLPVVNVIASDPTGSESDSNSVTFSFHRSFSTFQYLTLHYTISGSASNGLDYPVLSNAISIPPGELSTNLVIVPTPDSSWETNETIVITLVTNINYIIGFPPRATAVIEESPFDQWRRAKFTPAEYADSAISGPRADPDGDGVANLLEYAFDLDPKLANSGRHVDFTVTTAGNTDYLQMTYRRRKPPVEALYLAQAGSTLTNWPWTVTEIATNNHSATLDEIIARVDTPVSSVAVMHARLAVSLEPELKVAEVFSVARRILTAGRNYLGLVGEPPTNALSALLQTNRLAGADTEAGATVVDFWSQTAQVLTNRVWLSNLAEYPGWRATGTFADTNHRLLDLQKGFIVTVREGHGPLTNYLAGYLPRGPLVQTIQNNGYTLVSSRWPQPVALAQAGLTNSGFVGGTSLVTSDRVLFFNPATQLFDDKIWFDSVAKVWRDQNAAIATQRLEAGVGVLIHRRNRSGHMSWTNPVPYNVSEVWP